MIPLWKVWSQGQWAHRSPPTLTLYNPTHRPLPIRGHTEPSFLSQQSLNAWWPQINNLKSTRTAFTHSCKNNLQEMITKTRAETIFWAWPNFVLPIKQWMVVSGHQASLSVLSFPLRTIFHNTQILFQSSTSENSFDFFFFFLRVQGDWHSKFCPQWRGNCKSRHPNPFPHGWGLSRRRFCSALYKPHYITSITRSFGCNLCNLSSWERCTRS